MTAREAGFLLLTSPLGNPGRKVLTDAQLRNLSKRVALLPVDDPLRELEVKDFLTIGYSEAEGRRILELLSDREQLEWYLKYARRSGCIPITRISAAYPEVLRQKLGAEAPGCLWAKGEISILEMPKIALVGSRELKKENRVFAQEVGRQAARQGFALVSGNAKGSDQEAQRACLDNGGYVISVVADSLTDKTPSPRELLLAEGGFDLSFTPQRALHRNIVIHCLAQKVFVAQSGLESGGTWDGCIRNLRKGYSPVFCLQDGSAAVAELVSRGAGAIRPEDLLDFPNLTTDPSLF